MEFSKTDLGRHCVASDLFETVYWSLGFVKIFVGFLKIGLDRHGIVKDRDKIFVYRYGILKDRLAVVTELFRIVMFLFQNCLGLLMISHVSLKSLRNR